MCLVGISVWAILGFFYGLKEGFCEEYRCGFFYILIWEKDIGRVMEFYEVK